MGPSPSPLLDDKGRHALDEQCLHHYGLRMESMAFV